MAPSALLVMTGIEIVKWLEVNLCVDSSPAEIGRKLREKASRRAFPDPHPACSLPDNLESWNAPWTNLVCSLILTLPASSPVVLAIWEVSGGHSTPDSGRLSERECRPRRGNSSGHLNHMTGILTKGSPTIGTTGMVAGSRPIAKVDRFSWSALNG